MNTKRIEEIQKETAYPDSISVQQALLKVWNECEQEKVVKNNAVLPLVSNNEVAVCENCRFNKPKNYHDHMWCRDCQQKNHFEQTDC